jgi:hypothetical protein
VVPVPARPGCRNAMAPSPVRAPGTVAVPAPLQPRMLERDGGRFLSGWVVTRACPYLQATDERRIPRRSQSGSVALPPFRMPASPGYWNAMAPDPARAGGAVQVPEATDPDRRNETEPVPVRLGGAVTVPVAARSAEVVAFPVGETARHVKACRMWRIRTAVAAGAAVKIMGARIWYADSLAPRHGFEPRF